MGTLATLFGFSEGGLFSAISDFGDAPTPFHPGWPVTTGFVEIPAGTLRLRPLRKADGRQWASLRVEDEQYLRPVEPTVEGSWKAAHDIRTWKLIYGSLIASARDGFVVPMVIELDGNFVGQVTLGNIQTGAVSSCWIGYWVHHSLHGQGVATAAVALGVDLAMASAHLHRVDATVLKHNVASQRVLEHNGFRLEGELKRNLYIDGQWQDHLLYAITAEECPAGAVCQLEAAGRLRRVH